MAGLRPLHPQDLSARDAELLARLAHGLHGVQFLHWDVEEPGLTFTAFSLRTTVVGRTTGQRGAMSNEIGKMEWHAANSLFPTH